METVSALNSPARDMRSFSLQYNSYNWASSSRSRLNLRIPETIALYEENNDQIC